MQELLSSEVLEPADELVSDSGHIFGRAVSLLLIAGKLIPASGVTEIVASNHGLAGVNPPIPASDELIPILGAIGIEEGSIWKLHCHVAPVVSVLAVDHADEPAHAPELELIGKLPAVACSESVELVLIAGRDLQEEFPVGCGDRSHGITICLRPIQRNRLQH